VRSTPTLTVRANADPAELVTTLRREALAIASVRYVEVTPLSELANRSNRQMRSWRLGAMVFTLFGVIAIGVAGVGLYALLAYGVTQRRREIGIRMALGASGRSVVGQVLRGAAWTVGPGLAGDSCSLPGRRAAWRARCSKSPRAIRPFSCSRRGSSC
jgi:ABC-type antimicrobial peptide transport system permease subunit